jgi:hypothetical protein
MNQQVARRLRLRTAERGGEQGGEQQADRIDLRNVFTSELLSPWKSSRHELTGPLRLAQSARSRGRCYGGGAARSNRFSARADTGLEYSREYPDTPSRPGDDSARKAM